ncbi:hypothetical protein ABN584_25225 [Gloeocapsa sp. BRSZ]
MIKYLFIGLATVTFPSVALATKCEITSTQAQGQNGELVALRVAPGYGINLNFMPTGEIIKPVWLGDLSRITVSFDSNLCLGSQQNCTDEGATVIRLQQIAKINFPNQVSSSDGSTVLTAVAEGTTGKKLYQFKIIPTTSPSDCLTLTIKPDAPPTFVSEELPPLSDQATNLIPKSDYQVSPSQVSPSQSNSIAKATTLIKGLVLARQRGQIGYQSKLWRQVQTVVLLLRRNTPVEEAIKRSGLPVQILNQLLSLGSSTT